MSSSLMPLQFTFDPLLEATTSNSESGFFSLPLEVRLLIYDKLLIQSDELLRTFCTCKFCAALKSPTVGTDCLNPALLRTNKAVLYETLPILYSKNDFSFFCYGPFAFTSRLTISTQRGNVPGTVQRASASSLSVGPIANRHSAWAGVVKINKCPSDAAKPHVRRISFKLDSVYHRVLDRFPNQWWSTVESDVLRYFPGLEQMRVQIAVKEIAIRAFYLVFRRKDLMTARRQDYKSILADAASLLYSRASAKDDLRNIEAVCDAVLASQTQGELNICKFGVEMVSWTDDSLNGAGLSGPMFNINLGCH